MMSCTTRYSNLPQSHCKSLLLGGRFLIRSTLQQITSCSCSINNNKSKPPEIPYSLYLLALATGDQCIIGSECVYHCHLEQPLCLPFPNMVTAGLSHSVELNKIIQILFLRLPGTVVARWLIRPRLFVPPLKPHGSKLSHSTAFHWQSSYGWEV